MSLRCHPVLRWLDDPAADQALHLLETGAEETWWRWPYRDVAVAVRRAASLLADQGAGDGDTVVVALDGAHRFTAAWFGALALGARPCAIQPPGQLGGRTQYMDHLRELLRVVSPRVIVCRESAVALFRATVESIDLRARVMSENALIDGDPGFTIQVNEPAGFIQFTSGTTRSPRPLMISSDALIENVNAIKRWLRFDNDTRGASWLPLHHDMGLIGHLLLPVILGIDEWRISPAQFLRRPIRWLRCLSEHRITVTAAPAFGYAHAVARISSEELEGLTFSRLTAAIIGAERVSPRVIEDFLALVEPHGFERETLTPAYGLAEATLAVSGKARGAPMRYSSLTAEGVGETWSDRRPGRDPSDEHSGAAVAISCGSPLPGVEVHVVDEHGERLPERKIGEIVVRSPALASGLGPEHRTGDAGFVVDGELFVIGRMGDSMAIRGRQVFAEQLEQVVSASLGQRAVVVLGSDPTGPRALVVLESRCPPQALNALGEVVARELDPTVELVVVVLPSRRIRRTSSGKPRRRSIWSELLAGQYDDHRIVGSPTAHTVDAGHA